MRTAAGRSGALCCGDHDQRQNGLAEREGGGDKIAALGIDVSGGLSALFPLLLSPLGHCISI